MPLPTRPPALPAVQTGMTYQDYLKKYMDQYGVKSQPYDVTAGQVAPQSPMQVNPGQIAQSIAKGALTKEALGAGAGALEGIGGSTAAADALIGTTMPTVGPTLANAAALPSSAAAPGLLSGVAAAPAYIPAAVLGSVALGAKGVKDLLQGNKTKGLEGWGGRATLGIATGGLSELARPFFQPSIKDQVKDRWKGLAGSTTNQPTLNYIDQYRKYLDSDQQKIDGSGANTFAAKKEAGTLTGKDVWGGAGMIKTFGDDWLGKYSEGQREAISNELLKRNLVESKKGDINITDAGAAQTAASDILKLLSAPASGSAAPRVAIPRSSTLSPGIRKDGSRIDYSKKRK